MPLSMDVGLRPRHIVLDGAQLRPPRRKKAQPPNSRPTSVVAKRLGGLKRHLVRGRSRGPGDIVFDGDLAPLKLGTAPTFLP